MVVTPRPRAFDGIELALVIQQLLLLMVQKSVQETGLNNGILNHIVTGAGFLNHQQYDYNMHNRLLRS